MACCMFGLLLVYQLIEAWQRARRLGRGFWQALRTGITRGGKLRRVVWVALIFFQLGVAVAYVEAHGTHLTTLADNASTDFGQLCRGALAVTGRMMAPDS